MALWHAKPASYCFWLAGSWLIPAERLLRGYVRVLHVHNYATPPRVVSDADLGDFFPSPRKHKRYSLLNFVFWPRHMQTLPAHENYLSRACPDCTPKLNLGLWPMHPAAPVADGDSTWSVFREAVRWCLFGLQSPHRGSHGGGSITTGTNLIPEVMMAEISRRFNLTFKTRGLRSIFSFTAGNKMRMEAPPYERSFWHSHNMTAVARWLDKQERMRQQAA